MIVIHKLLKFLFFVLYHFHFFKHFNNNILDNVVPIIIYENGLCKKKENTYYNN